MSIQRRGSIALATLAAILILPKGAYGQDFTGTYTTEIPVRIENRGDAETVSETATVTLTLTQTGETVHGTWQLSSRPDRPNPQPRALHGVVRDAKLFLTDTTEAQIRRGGELPMTVQMVNTMELTLDGDRLTGTQSAQSVDGTIRAQPRPVTATRVR